MGPVTKSFLISNFIILMTKQKFTQILNCILSDNILYTFLNINYVNNIEIHYKLTIFYTRNYVLQNDIFQKAIS